MTHAKRPFLVFAVTECVIAVVDVARERVPNENHIRRLFRSAPGLWPDLLSCPFV